jgi:GNAT superfamily N-acetyltransferase
VALQAPVLLTAAHQLTDFDCGEPSLNDWLKRRALANTVSGATRTYVACEGDPTTGGVAGYYALAAGDVSAALVPGKIKRNMPDPVPVVLLARLAVDRRWQGKQLGRSLFRNAVQRVLQAADQIGIRAIVVQAISEDARRFYLAMGFDPCPGDPRMLVVTLKDALSCSRSRAGFCMDMELTDASKGSK